MEFLYVVSSGEAAGKTMIAAGLGKYLIGVGKKVGFLKPVIGSADTRDAVFMSQILGLSEPVDFICPTAGTAGEVQQACTRVSPEKDVVIIESRLAEHLDDNYEVAKRLNAKVIIVESYADQPLKKGSAYGGFGENLLGVIINRVPVSRVARVQDETAARFREARVNVLGIIPEDRVLAVLSIGEIVECVQGKILNNEEKAADLVANVMLGAMVVDSGLEYFGRKADKAAIIRSDRPDMQLAALETKTRCLVISGAREELFYNVRQKAESKGIPIIITENDTNTIINSLEGCFSKVRFSQEKKLSYLVEVLKQHLDLKALAKV
ncbi:DRTGG domain-containing protein [Chloroflexota bacterium]